MSLDVYLRYTQEQTEFQRAAALLRAHGMEKAANNIEWAPDPDAVDDAYSANITHNLNTMANAAWIYECLWRPEDVGITKAKQLIKPLEAGIKRMRANPAKFKKHNAPNGWGKYEHFLPFCERYLEACKQHPEALVYASR